MYQKLLLMAPSLAESILEATQTLGNSAELTAPASSELTEAANTIVGILPPIISNNYSLVLGTLFAYLAIHILKSGIKLALFIVIVAVLSTILTNMGIMPDLNAILQSLNSSMPLVS